MPVRLLALVVVVVVSGCTVDEKGLTCGLLDPYITAAGETYCPDPAAADDCVLIRDAMVESFVRCGANDDAATAAAASTFDCSTAVATTTSFDDCISALDDTDACLATAADLPDSCVGAVLLHAE